MNLNFPIAPVTSGHTTLVMKAIKLIRNVISWSHVDFAGKRRDLHMWKRRVPRRTIAAKPDRDMDL